MPRDRPKLRPCVIWTPYTVVQVTQRVEPGSDAAVIEEARQRTLATRGVRLRCREFSVPPYDWKLDDTMIGDLIVEGTADLAARRARVRYVTGGWAGKLGEMILARFPWLDDEDDDEDDDEFELIYVGGAEYAGANDRWSDFNGGDESGVRQTRDPTWILEALADLDPSSVQQGDDQLVRGGHCRAYVGRVDMLDVELAIGTDGLIRSITWSSRRGSRWRPGLIPRLISRGSFDTARLTEEHRQWKTLELWDFGIDTDIPVPTVDTEAAETPTWKILLELWRRRRDWLDKHQT